MEISELMIFTCILKLSLNCNVAWKIRKDLSNAKFNKYVVYIFCIDSSSDFTGTAVWWELSERAFLRAWCIFNKWETYWRRENVLPSFLSLTWQLKPPKDLICPRNLLAFYSSRPSKTFLKASSMEDLMPYPSTSYLPANFVSFDQ